MPVYLVQQKSIKLFSTAVGEPAACVAACIPFALREAIALARQESGIPTTEWFQIGKSFLKYGKSSSTQ